MIKRAFILALAFAATVATAQDTNFAVRISCDFQMIQQRREAEVDWNPLLAEIDALAKTELENESNHP